MAYVSRITLHDYFDRITDAVERKTLDALNAAAVAGAAEANRRAAAIGATHSFNVIAAAGSFDGYASGIKAGTPLWRVFDKGSLGKRGSTPLKGRNRRKPEWPVRQARRTYVAQRHDEALTSPDKGLSALDISNPARTAGRKALRLRISR